MRNVDPHATGAVEKVVSRPVVPAMAGAEGLLGLDVVDGHGELVGELWDMVLDLHAGRIAYGIVALERTQRTDRMIPVPWSAFAIDMGRDCLCVGAARDWVEQAPAIKPNALSRLLDPELVDLIDRHFAASPPRDRAASQTQWRDQRDRPLNL